MRYCFFADVFQKCNVELFDLKHSARVATSELERPPRPKEIKSWPASALRVGQITAVAINPDGNPVIFHRGERVWTEE